MPPVHALLLALALTPGTLVENVPTRADATQTYTLYLPSTYSATKTYPLLLVFDPRGRGTPAAEIFRDACEEYGWILISSNQTESDSGTNVRNERAIRALLSETAVYATDLKRVYATGFSGTAVLAWSVGMSTKRFAGVIGVGGNQQNALPTKEFNFAHYGFAGSRDFNNRHMRQIDDALEGVVPHRFHEFDGAHEWITPALARDAVGWFEVLAGNEKVRAKVMAGDIAAAEKMQGLAALRRWRAIERTYGVKPPVIDVARELAEEKKWDEFEAQYYRDVFSKLSVHLAGLRASDSPTTADAARMFRLKDLLRHAERPGPEGFTAKRILAAVHAQCAFRLPPVFFERNEPKLAIAVLGVAIEIHDDRWANWYNLGAAHARAGNRKQALDALEKSIALGFKDAKHLASDADYASVRDDKRFQELMALASSSQ